MNDWIAHLVVSAAVSLLTGGFGSYIGIRMAIVRIQAWQEMVGPKVEMHETRLNWHGEDILTHEMEIGLMMDKMDLRRVLRQTLRRTSGG